MNGGAAHHETTLSRDAYASFNEQGVRAFEGLLSPVVTWLESPSEVILRRSPRQDVLARMEELHWDDDLMEPEKFAVFGDRVVAAVKIRPRGRNGCSEHTCGHYWRFSDGSANRLEVHRSQAAAMDAAVGYLALLERLHQHLRPRTYVEIGVASGRSLGRARPETRIVGIDPKPMISDPGGVHESTKIFELTSDEFFRRHDLRAELGGQPVDLAFIDGMHLFEYALRDFINLEAHYTDRSVILVHDCRPRSPEQAGREPRPGAWTGDVWKLIPCLREQRPDLNVTVADVRPSGLGVITGLSPGSNILNDAFAEIVTRYMPLQWTEHAMHEPRPSIDQEWEAIETMLPPPPDGQGTAVP